MIAEIADASRCKISVAPIVALFVEASDWIAQLVLEVAFNVRIVMCVELVDVAQRCIAVWHVALDGFGCY